jgi:hypothetical protein
MISYRHIPRANSDIASLSDEESPALGGTFNRVMECRDLEIRPLALLPKPANDRGCPSVTVISGTPPFKS